MDHIFMVAFSFHSGVVTRPKEKHQECTKLVYQAHVFRCGWMCSVSPVSRSIRTDAHRYSDRSRTRLEDHVKRRLDRAAEAAEARFCHHLTQSAFTSLRTEPQARFLRE
jgi:hypothetical protein